MLKPGAIHEAQFKIHANKNYELPRALARGGDKMDWDVS